MGQKTAPFNPKITVSPCEELRFISAHAGALNLISGFIHARGLESDGFL